MDELTEQYYLYRECARMVRNAFLQKYEDCESDFVDIDDELFEAMLHSQVKSYRKPRNIGGWPYYPELKLLPGADFREPSVLCGRLENDKSFHWTSREWREHDVELRFVSLFDWGPSRLNFREFQYVEALVVETRDPAFALGQRVLIDATKVRVVDTSEFLSLEETSKEDAS